MQVREHFEALQTRLVNERIRTGRLGTLGPCKFVPIDKFLSKNFARAETARRPRERIVSLGDVHGDLAAFLAMLFKGECIDSNGFWIGKNTHVVQVGDFLDSGGRHDDDGKLISVCGSNEREELDIMQYAFALDKSARRKRGSVTLLAGNHELANFKGDFQCTTIVSDQGWGGRRKRARWFSRGPESALAQYFIRRHPVIITIGSIVFVHGGLGEPCRELAGLRRVRGARQRQLGSLPAGRRRQQVRYAAFIHARRVERLQRLGQAMRQGRGTVRRRAFSRGRRARRRPHAAAAGLPARRRRQRGLREHGLAHRRGSFQSLRARRGRPPRCLFGNHQPE